MQVKQQLDQQGLSILPELRRSLSGDQELLVFNEHGTPIQNSGSAELSVQIKESTAPIIFQKVSVADDQHLLLGLKTSLTPHSPPGSGLRLHFDPPPPPPGFPSPETRQPGTPLNGLTAGPPLGQSLETDHPPPPGPQGELPASALLAIGISASLCFCMLITWYLLKPLRHLQQALDLAASGNLTERIRPLLGNRQDEIADLASSYDTMAAKLDNMIKQQQRLFHDVSHELRSPLARIQAATGLVRQNPEHGKQSIIRIEHETQRLDKLIDELLTLARLESGNSLKVQRLPLSAILDSLLQDTQYTAKCKDIQIDYQPSVHDPMIEVDEIIAMRALDNILRNATKYSPSQTTITVSTKIDEDHVILQISDQGPGLPPSQLQRIFEPFYRYHRDSQGSGLGLAIAKQAIEVHHGTLTIANNDPGPGLLMEIRLPISHH